MNVTLHPQLDGRISRARDLKMIDLICIQPTNQKPNKKRRQMSNSQARQTGSKQAYQHVLRQLGGLQVQNDVLVARRRRNRSVSQLARRYHRRGRSSSRGRHRGGRRGRRGRSIAWRCTNVRLLFDIGIIALHCVGLYCHVETNKASKQAYRSSRTKRMRWHWRCRRGGRRS